MGRMRKGGGQENACQKHMHTATGTAEPYTGR